jgi:ribose 5-phosphate isomerase B
MNIAIGSDHAGLGLKKHLLNWLQEHTYQVKDCGTFTSESVDYPDIAVLVAHAVAKAEFHRGILICGSGIGVCIAANKVAGIRAALCYDTISARLSREHNNANILTLGERLITPMVAQEILEVWLKTEFQGGRHVQRVEKLDQLPL